MAYLHHLLADFRTIRETQHRLVTVNGCLSVIQEECQLGEWLGLDTEAFPPFEFWTIEEVTLLLKAFSDLWEAINLDADFPEILHPKIRYKLYVRAITEGVYDFEKKRGIVRFCTGIPLICPFGKRSCTCKMSENPTGLSTR